MKNLRYMCVQPASDYYIWQIEVVIHNFIKNGINPNNIDIVCGITKGSAVPAQWRKMADHYNTVRFFFYEDDRVDSPYVSSLRPNILKKHFAAHPEMKDEAIFYHDSDMIFTRPVDWSRYCNDDIWYCSDTRFYIGAEYIKEKGMGLYERMCEIVGIDESIPVLEELNAGGAQYIMKNIDAAYWEKVEKDCDALYAYFLKHLEVHPETPKYHPIQKWTADMWAVLWNGWYFGHVIKVVPDMEFTWGTQDESQWNQFTIFHNAGVVHGDNNKLFYKGHYMGGKFPYTIENTFPEGTASRKYVEEILETGKKSCLIDLDNPA